MTSLKPFLFLACFISVQSFGAANVRYVRGVAQASTATTKVIAVSQRGVASSGIAPFGVLGVYTDGSNTVTLGRFTSGGKMKPGQTVALNGTGDSLVTNAEVTFDSQLASCPNASGFGMANMPVTWQANNPSNVGNGAGTATHFSAFGTTAADAVEGGSVSSSFNFMAPGTYYLRSLYRIQVIDIDAMLKTVGLQTSKQYQSVWSCALAGTTLNCTNTVCNSLSY